MGQAAAFCIFILAFLALSSQAFVFRYEDPEFEVNFDLEESQRNGPLVNVQIVNNYGSSFSVRKGPEVELTDGTAVGDSVSKLRNDRPRRDPPPPDQTAQMARYIVQSSNWTSIATISSRDPTTGFPCASVFAVSDGPSGKSTGVPYLYVTAMDLSVRDLQKDPRTSLTMTLAQSDYCVNNKLDPEDPRCAHIILTGNFVKLVGGSHGQKFAKVALFSKHPAMAYWPPDHGFFFAKVDIANIIVLDNFGGASSVSVKDYYKAKVFV